MSGGDHSFDLNVSNVQANVSGAALAVPATVRGATVPTVRVESQELADGVWYLGGSSHNSDLPPRVRPVLMRELDSSSDRSAVLG